MKTALAIGAALLLSACGRTPLPVLGEVPEFQLVSQSGHPFGRAELSGRVWVANFFFTTCAGPCPRMSAQMRQVQTATGDLPGVRLVSFSVDPGHDTPPVLAEYARRFRAQDGRWFFLTGGMAQLDSLGRETFHLNRVDGNRDHSTRFVLVDRRGRIRGYYLSAEEGFLKRLLDDLRLLNSERTS